MCFCYFLLVFPVFQVLLVLGGVFADGVFDSCFVGAVFARLRCFGFQGMLY